MKFLLASLSIALATSTLAAAPAEPAPVESAQNLPEPTARQMELASRLVALTFTADDYVRSMRGAAEGTVASLDEAFGAESENPEIGKSLQRVLDQLEHKIRAKFPQLADAYARVYAREYSEVELQQLVDFAQSPAGKRYLSGDGGFESDPAIEALNAEMGEEMKKALDGMRKEACAAQANQRLAAGDPDAKCPLSA